MPSAVIFDLDGTLADTIEDLANSLNRSLAARKLPIHDFPAYKMMVGNGFRNLVIAALPEDKRQEALVSEIHAEASDWYAHHLVDATRPYPGVVDLLAALAEKGIPLAILSNKPEKLVISMVESLFPQAGFAFVRGETGVFPRKPAPDQAQDLARRLGLPAKDIVYLGDSDVDMMMARNAGMIAAGAGWGFRGAAELTASGAEFIVQSPLEILAHFDKWR